MALGYEGYVQVDRTGTPVPLLCTGFQASQNRTRLDAGSAYYGVMNTPQNQRPVGLPHTYDFPVIDGSLDYEIYRLPNNTLPALSFTTGLLANRDVPFKIDAFPRSGGYQEYQECFWTSMTISIQEASAFAINMAFLAVELNDYDVGGDYEDNREGINPDPMDTLACVANLVPYWRVGLTGDLNILLSTWTLTLNQEVQRFFSCEAQDVSVAPPLSFIGIGPMTGQFVATFIPDDGWNPVAGIPLSIGNINLQAFGNTFMSISGLELQDQSDPIEGADSQSIITAIYEIYGYNIP